MDRFLICHRGALGDFILTWPALYALRQSLPDVQFVGLGRTEYMRLAIGLGLLDTCCHAESSGMSGLFDGRSIPAVLGSPIGAVLWLAEGQAVRDLLRKSARLPVALIPPFPQKRVHVAVYHCLAVREYFPVEVSTSFPSDESRLFVNEIQCSFCLPLNIRRGEYALIHPGSGSPAKNYLPRFYRDLADELRQQGFPEVRFILGPAEGEDMARYLSGERVERPHDVEELGRLQAGASLYIGNDSGASHLAAVLGTPTIALYKVTDPDMWGVIGPHAVNLRAQTEDLAFRAIQDTLAQFSFAPQRKTREWRMAIPHEKGSENM
ncbi:MAG: glycosyltransferase family 9 protein [bacterium]